MSERGGLLIVAGSVRCADFGKFTFLGLVFGVAVQNWANTLDKVMDIFELSVHTGKANVCDIIQFD